MENPPIFKNGKPSISMGHLYHGYVSHNQVGYPHFAMVNSHGSSNIRTKTNRAPDTRARRTAVAAASGWVEFIKLYWAAVKIVK